MYSLAATATRYRVKSVANGTSMFGYPFRDPMSITALRMIFSTPILILRKISATSNPNKMITITLHHQRFNIKPGTKSVWVLASEETRVVTEGEYDNSVEAAPWFRKLGGSESLSREYTPSGKKVTRIISKSPCRTQKIIRRYEFKWTQK